MMDAYKDAAARRFVGGEAMQRFLFKPELFAFSPSFGCEYRLANN